MAVIAVAMQGGRAQDTPAENQTPSETQTTPKTTAKRKSATSAKASATHESAPADPALGLASGQWQFASIGSTQVVGKGPHHPYLKFDSPTHSITGFTGCNRLSGKYKAAESTLAFENVVTTRMACVKDPYEQQLLDVLNSATAYKILDGELRVLGPKGTLALLTQSQKAQSSPGQPTQK